MPGKEIRGRSARANYRHGGRTGFKHGSPHKQEKYDKKRGPEKIIQKTQLGRVK